MSDRLIDVAEVLRRMVKALDGLEEGEAVAFALRIMEERNELQDQMVRLIEAGHLMAEVSTEYRRKIWLEAVKEATK